jgi:muconate/chloromuconate cycloisomerase
MKIEAIDVALVDVPAARPIQMSFTTVQRQSYAIVQIHAGGLVGIGEGSSVGGPTWSCECAETIKAIIEGYLAPLLLEKDATNLSEAQRLMDKAVTGNYSAKAAIDVALHDLKARALGVSMGDLIGGPVRSSIPIAWTLASGSTERDIETANEMIERRRHNRFKVKLGARTPKEDCRHIERIIDDIGGRATVRVDVNQAWDEPTASIWIPRLEALGVELIEQPVARANFDALRRLSADNGVAIMADESLGSLASAFELARGHCVDVFSLKLCNMGGVANTLKVAAVAEASGIMSYGGTMLDSSIGTAAALHVYSTLSSMPYGCELLGPWVLADTLTQTQLEIRDYEIQVPAGPGLGVEIDRDKLRHFTRTS